MELKSIKRRIRRLGHQLGLWADWEQRLAEINNTTRQEMGADWYDRAYSKSDSYRAHYSQSCYYSTWCVIADRILREDTQRILEIGCGPGQFAQFLADQGVLSYTGIDFSPTAIEMARSNAPKYHFVVDDARTSDVYERFEYDTVVCTEVLEHIEDDLVVISRFVPGKRAICTVPNFPYASHVRHFRGKNEVEDRYSRYFDNLSVLALKGVRNPSEEFFLFDGIRSSHSQL